MLLKVYVKEKHNLPEIINFFLICSNFKKNYLTNFVASQFWWMVDCGFNSNRHIFIKNFVLVFMKLIRSELYCFGIIIQKMVFQCLYRSKANYIRLNSLNIKKSAGAKLSPFVIYIKVIICLLW